jgi:hypothetical protein
VGLSGNVYTLKVRGYAVVFKGAGQWDFSTGKLVGIHTSADPEEMAKFCALLAAS